MTPVSRIVAAAQTSRGETLELCCECGVWAIVLDGERFEFRSERVARLAFEAACDPRAA